MVQVCVFEENYNGYARYRNKNCTKFYLFCVCEENCNGYARCRNKNCTKCYPFSFPKMASTETGKECTMSLPKSWRDKLKFNCECVSQTTLDKEVHMLKVGNDYYFFLDIIDFIF